MNRQIFLLESGGFAVCLLLLLCVPAYETGTFKHNPVVLVPGDGGSQLWARLNNTANQWYCRRTSGAAELLWLQMSNLVYPAVKCLAYNLMLRKSIESSFFDDAPGDTIDNVGVESFVPGFGSVDTMLWIADWHSKYTVYYATLVNHLVAKYGYLSNDTIHGAPYDFRKAPNELTSYFQQLKDLIEDAFFKAGGKRIVLVSHSMGGKLALHFLHMQSDAWKEKYIKHFIAAGGAFGGVSASLLALLSGYSLGIPLVRPLWFRPVQRSWPSTHYLLPDPAAYPDDQPLIRSPSGDVFTVTNLTALFNHAGFKEGSEDFAAYSRLTDVARPPGVTTTCVFGANVPTPSEMRWVGDFPDAQPSSIVHDSGDGTIALAATSRVCRAWSRGQKDRVRVTELAGAQHVAMLSDKRFLSLVASIAASGED